MDKQLFINATEKAAIGASKFIGKGDKIAADKGAVDPMRDELNKINALQLRISKFKSYNKISLAFNKELKHSNQKYQIN